MNRAYANGRSGLNPPPPEDDETVAMFVRLHGSILFALDEIPGEFTAWRRSIRQAARRAGIRISVRRDADTVLIYHRDHETTPEQMRAVMDVMGGLMAPSAGQPAEPTLTYDEALRRRRRQRMTLIHGGLDSVADQGNSDTPADKGTHHDAE